MKCGEINAEINQVIDELIKPVNQEEDSHCILSRRHLTNNLREKLKFSYLLFCFVSMFGYIALISPATPDIKKFLGILKLKSMKEMMNKFIYLSTTKLGADILAKNEKFGDNICKVILKVSKDLQIQYIMIHWKILYIK